MRILHLVHQYLPEQLGGVELYTWWLTQALRVRGWEPAIFVPFYAADAHSPLEYAVPLYFGHVNGRVPSVSRRFLATFSSPTLHAAFERALDETRPHIVHVQHLMGMPSSIFIALRARGIPYIITLHDYWWVCANAQLLTNYNQTICDGPRAFVNCGRCVAARLGTPLMQAALPAFALTLAARYRLLRDVLLQAEMLLAPTRFVKQWYAAHGIPAEKIRILVPGVEPPRLPVVLRQAGRSHVRFLYLGGLAPQKGVHVALEAFRRLQGDAEFWIAGHSTDDRAYEATLRALATPRVKFLGTLTRERVWQTLGEVDVVLVPSLWYETFCFVVHEAFAAGRPVLASNLGALAERVHHEVDGLLVEPGNVDAWHSAMQRVMDDPALLERLRQGVRPPRLMDEHVEELMGVYARLVSCVS
nr:glycosyltransferase family 4 protein [Ardenticatena sp.]